MSQYNNLNIMTIDLEDYYNDVDFQQWDNYEDRIVDNTNKILNLLEKTHTKATFFTLGYYAEKYPELISKISKQNHEIALHGYNHTPLHNLSKNQFENDLIKSIKILREITNKEVFGYRAPTFSLNHKTIWALDILKKYFLYDSSIFPSNAFLYGMPSAYRFPHIIKPKNLKKNIFNQFYEIPLSTYRIPFIEKNIPIAGGFYLRFFPSIITHHAIGKLNYTNQPAVSYIHPWEIDQYQPRIKFNKWYHYYNLNKTEHKLMILLNRFRFVSIIEFLKQNGKRLEKFEI